MTRLYRLIPLLWLSGCLGIPDQVTAVSGFELPRYLGTWYEVARLDHRFERGLSEVTANYTLQADGSARVVNRGYNARTGAWEEAVGKARPVGAADSGRLKVSFFGPFYASYNIIALDHQAYEYALVVGPSTDYLWLLARRPRLDPAIVNEMLDKARRAGFAVDQLIYVEHGRVANGGS